MLVPWEQSRQTGSVAKELRNKINMRMTWISNENRRQIKQTNIICGMVVYIHNDQYQK